MLTIITFLVFATPYIKRGVYHATIFVSNPYLYTHTPTPNTTDSYSWFVSAEISFISLCTLMNVSQNYYSCTAYFSAHTA